jgi:hypothetical protein
MRRILVCGVLALVPIGAAVAQQAAAPAHILVTAPELKWGEPPPVFEKGMSFTAATVQVEGLGPFALTYVNPADDPSKR